MYSKNSYYRKYMVQIASLEKKNMQLCIDFHFQRLQKSVAKLTSNWSSNVYVLTNGLPRRNSGRGGGTGHLGNLHKLRMPEILAQVQLEDPPEEQVLPWNRDQKFKPLVIPRPEQVKKLWFLLYFSQKSIYNGRVVGGIEIGGTALTV